MAPRPPNELRPVLLQRVSQLCRAARTMTAAIGPCLGFQVFSFVVGIKAESIEKCKAFTCHRDGNLRSELNVAACLATHDWPDMSLAKADDAVGNASAVRLVKNALLTDQVADNQQLLVDVSTSCQKACTADGQGVDIGQISPEMAKLLSNRLTDFVNARPLLLGHG